MRSLIIIAAVLLATASSADEKLQVAIVVDRDNPRADISLEELRALFLGKQKEWSDGSRAIPLDLEPGSPERAIFNAQVLGMEQDEVDRYWVDQRVRGTGNQPRMA